MVVDGPLLFETFEPVSGRVRSQTFGERMTGSLTRESEIVLNVLFPRLQMPPRATNLTAGQLAQVRRLIGEEINQILHNVLPDIVDHVTAEIKAMLDERLATIPNGGPGPLRDMSYYNAQFSKCSPPQFKGATDPVTGIHWISDIEGAFLTSGCPDEFKVRCATNLLRYGAKSWWKAMTAKWSEDQIIAMSWGEFRERFEAQYVPRVEQQRIQNEFMSLKQTTETVLEMNNKFMDMLTMCPKYADDEDWQITRYTSMLRSEIREFVSTTDHATLTSLMDAARRREIELDLQETEKKRKAVVVSNQSSNASKKGRFEGNNSGKKFVFRPGGNKKGPLTKLCFRCHREGHQIADCPEERPQHPQPMCFNCNEVGHKRPECPKLNNRGNNQGSRPANGAPTNTGGRRPEQNRMVTRGRAHQLTGDTPAANDNVAGNNFDS